MKAKCGSYLVFLEAVSLFCWRWVFLKGWESRLSVIPQGPSEINLCCQRPVNAQDGEVTSRDVLLKPELAALVSALQEAAQEI